MTIKQRCDFTNCTKFARPGRTRCTTHKDAIDRKPGPLSPIEARLAQREFGKFTPIVMQAAADADGVDNEIAVLRLVMQRLLDEEPDPSRQAAGIARIAGTIIQAMRAKRTLSGTAADEFTDAVSLILEELHQ